MSSPAPDRERCALMVQRLIDADLLLAEEGNALLAQIEAWNPPANGDDAQRRRADRFVQALGAILYTDRLEAAARQAALETAHALLHQPTASTAPETQSGRPRD